MARWWKKRRGTLIDVGGYVDGEGHFIKEPFVYYVYVCSFTFRFSSLGDISDYIEHYETKILPSSCIRHFTPGPEYGDHEECQGRFERLPLRLRDNSRRPRVIKALKAALAEFQKTKGNRA